MDKPGPWKWITRPVSVNLSASISVTLRKGDSSVPSLGLQRRLSELVDTKCLKSCPAYNKCIINNIHTIKCCDNPLAPKLKYFADVG